MISNKTQPHLLAISWAIPPLLLPNSMPVARILRGLRMRGWRITVFTVNPSSVPGWVSMDHEMAHYYERDYEILSISSPEKSFLFHALGRLLPVITRYPDDKRFWANRTMKAIKTWASTNSPDALMTFAQPWSSHIVGLAIQPQLKIPWIAHFSDPWVENTYSAWTPSSRRYAESQEHAVMKKATHVIFVSEQTRAITLRRYPSSWQTKATCIPHGFDAELLPSERHVSNLDGNIFTIAYAGHFYGLRQPDHFFAALRQAAIKVKDQISLRFILVGPATSRVQGLCNRMSIREHVQFMGPQPFSKTQKILSEADALLLLDAPNPDENVFLPSKLIDYLPLEKPILGMTPLRGASADVLRDLQYRLADPLDVASTAAHLRALALQKKSGDLVPSPVHKAIAARYDIQTLTARFDEILRSL